MMWFDGHMSGWDWTWMAVFMVIFWGLVIAGIVALVRYLNRSGQQTGPGSPQGATAEQVLADRFARGEIDEEEYHRRLEALRSSGQPLAKP